jgi:hypothetical protein
MVSQWFKSLSAVLTSTRKSRPASKRPGSFRPRMEVLEDRTVPANIHLIGDPTFSLVGTTLVVDGKLAGLGNKDIKIDVVAEGTATYDVTNPAGNEAPGISKKVGGSNTVTITKVQIEKNGNYVFSIGVNLNTNVDLPNSQWTATLTSVTFESVSFSVTQGKTVVEFGPYEVSF